MYTELFETIYSINKPSKEKGILVTEVDSSAVGFDVGIEVGDRILSVNGRMLRDYIDWQYYTGSEEIVSLEIKKRTGEIWQTKAEVGEGEVWGLDFESFVPRQCANDCIFCFCNQNPPGSRESLFFKDEDFRLSFLHGNYTTMSSTAKTELDRIVDQRLSPQYVSVHATDPEVRRYLLGRKKADDVIAKMKYLAERGIELHAQIVLCPTINDGEVLERTINDLGELHPGLKSIAIVPVVFTKLHNYRHLLTPVTDDFSRDLIRRLRPIQREFRRRLGTTFVFLADEFYLRAGISIPGRAHYGEYPQIEDGVGMVRRFIIESRHGLRKNVVGDFRVENRSLYGTVATGELFFPILSRFIEEMNYKLETRLKPLAIKNRFFGEEITVAGLIAGGDVIAARREVEGEFLIVPEQACLKQGHIFLDDVTLEEIEIEVGIPVMQSGRSLLSMLERAEQLVKPNPKGLEA